MIQNKAAIQKLELQKAQKTLINSIEIQEEERSRIGADIHDDLGPTLSTLKLKLNNLKSDKPITDRNLSQLKIMIEETIKSVRGISHSLYPNTLEKYGLKNAIEELSNRVENETLTLDLEIDEEVEQISYYRQIYLYRIIQEFCNNSFKYSNCTSIKIKIEYEKEILSTLLSDNGDGFQLEDQEMGLGLKNMKMRADVLNLNFNFTTEVGHGTTLKLTTKDQDKNEQ